MRYKNTKTGAIVDSASIVKGENWEVVKEPKLENDEVAETEEEVDLQELNKVQLSDMLDEKGIEYKAKDTKEKLIKLLTEE